MPRSTLPSDRRSDRRSHRRSARTALVAATTSLAASLLALPLSGALASPTSPSGPVAAPDGTVSLTDARTMPWQRKYDAIRQDALEQRLRTGGRGPTERVAPGTYGRVAQTGTDEIFTLLVQFGDTRHSAYPDGESDATTFDGPMHNQIPKPDRTKDNSTLWQADYDRAHYEDMYFTRMKRFYELQSNGKYSIAGDVQGWVTVPFNEARYGRNTCGDIVCNNTWFLIRDALARWTQNKLDSGMTMTEVQDYLAQFDHQDRYDFDEDGDFTEPDGYIDHFQIVHAGGDEADGDPVYGEDAIWSHRWYAQIEPQGTGPADGGQFGGVDVGEGGVSDPSGANVTIPDNPTGVWVGDYTIQPENGGLSVFAHEYGHDLGLPDLYDTSGNTGGAENSVGWWSLMSQSRGTAQGDPGIGDRPMPFGAWDKFQLGWLDYEVARPGRTSTHVLEPNGSSGSTATDGLVVVLPDKEVELDLGSPYAGERFYYSDMGNDLDNTMTTELDEPLVAPTPLTAQVDYDIEPGWDYAFLEASADGGETWESLETSESYDGEDESGLDPDGTGISGSTDGEWTELTATVPAGTDALRWRYTTDGAFALTGFKVDDIALGGEVVGDAESDAGWVFDGFRTTTGTETQRYLNAYFVDNRQYVGYDRVSKHVYNFGFKNQSKVEFFANNEGALISYWDTSYADNNVGDHPGHGEILPVDAWPELDHLPDGTLVRPRTLAQDATFSLERSPAETLHHLGTAYTLEGHKAVPTFDDRLEWWYPNDEHVAGGETHDGRYQPGWYSVDVPRTGTRIQVLKVTGKGMLTVKVS